MKKALIILLFFVTFAANARGAKRNSSYLEDLKFGLHLKSIIPGNKIGAFAEYKIHEALGVQSGLFYFLDYYFMAKQDAVACVAPQYLSVPLIFRFYPGSDAQFCLFAGLETSYVIGGSCLTVEMPNTEKEPTELLDYFKEYFKRLFSNEVFSDLAQKIESDDLSSWAFHFVSGLDHEYSGGFQWGLEIGYGLTQFFEDYEDYGNFTAKMILGYNFAKLF